MYGLCLLVEHGTPNGGLPQRLRAATPRRRREPGLLELGAFTGLQGTAGGFLTVTLN